MHLFPLSRMHGYQPYSALAHTAHQGGHSECFASAHGEPFAMRDACLQVVGLRRAFSPARPVALGGQNPPAPTSKKLQRELPEELHAAGGGRFLRCSLMFAVLARQQAPSSWSTPVASCCLESMSSDDIALASTFKQSAAERTACALHPSEAQANR